MEAEAKRIAAEAESKRLAAEAEAKRRADAIEEERRKNPIVSFRIRSTYPGSVAVQFRSSTDRRRFWPAFNRTYVIRDGNEQAYQLRCEQGETICFGAWVEGSALNRYWGGGYQVQQPCTGCCLTCPAVAGWSWTLEPRTAITPVPSLIWNIRNNRFPSISLVFYSMSRLGHAWPGGNQEYLLHYGQPQTFKLTCRAGEQICYGAWPTGNPWGGGWGVGFNARLGCANCCHACDGTETQEITLD
jgi:hypothetical protein